MKKIESHFPDIDIKWEIETELERINVFTQLVREGDGLSLNILSSSVFGDLIPAIAHSKIKENQYLDLLPKPLLYYIEYKLNAALGAFDYALHPGEPIKVVLGEEQFILEGAETDRGINQGDWKGIFQWSIISNNENALNRLLQIPENIMRESSMSGDEYRFLYIRFLHSLYSDPQKSSAYLMEAYEATDPAVLKIQDPNFVLTQVVPEMDLWASLLMRDHKQFNERLASALEFHKEYVIKKKLEKTPGYLIHPMLIAICVLAHRNGFPIEVESDYIPRFLIEGKF